MGRIQLNTKVLAVRFKRAEGRCRQTSAPTHRNHYRLTQEDKTAKQAEVQKLHGILHSKDGWVMEGKNV